MKNFLNKINPLKDTDQDLIDLIEAENPTDLEEAYSSFILGENSDDENINRIISKLEKISNSTAVTKIRSFIFNGIKKIKNFLKRIKNSFEPYKKARLF